MLVCQKCSTVNPTDAVYCYHDGIALAAQASTGPVNLGAQGFASPFVFPSGKSAASFDQLATLCQQNWNEAAGLIKQGAFAGFFLGLGRADLSTVAQEAAKAPDPQRGLDLLLSKLPSQALKPPKLEVLPKEMNVGQLPLGSDRHLELKLSNSGNRLVYGSVASDSKWISLGEGAGSTEKLFQTGTSTTIPVHIQGKQLRAGSKPLEGEIVIRSNVGQEIVKVRVDVPVKPFPDGILGGALSPRDVAIKAKAQPKEAAVLFENGTVARWFQENGWTYPVQGPAAVGLSAVQQFFEALGLVQAPKIEIGKQEIVLSAGAGQAVQTTIEVRTQEKRAVYAHAVSDEAWVDVSKTQHNGRIANIVVRIAQVPPRQGETLTATIRVHANGNQRFAVPLRMTVLPPGSPVTEQGVGPVGAPLDFDVPGGATVGGQAAQPAGKNKRGCLGMYVHFLPVVALAFLLLLIFILDLAWAPAREAVANDGEIPIVATPRLLIKFDHKDPKKPEQDRDAGDSSRFGLTAVGGQDVERGDKRLTFDARGRSNSTVLMIDGKEKVFGPLFAGTRNPAGDWTGSATDLGQRGGKSRTFAFSSDKIDVTQQVKLVPGEPVMIENGKYRRLLDTCWVGYTIENKDTKNKKKVGLRTVIDTFIGWEDAVPFAVPGLAKLVDDCHEFKADAVPDFFQALENPDLANPGTILQFSLKTGTQLEAPAHVLLTRWPETKLHDKWKIPLEKFTPEGQAGGAVRPDSAVALYWSEQDLEPGKSRTVGYCMGLGTVSSQTGQLGLAYKGDLRPGGEFTVIAYVSNPQPKQTVTLTLPAGFELMKGSSAEQEVPALPSGIAKGNTPVTWRARSGPAGTHMLAVRSSTGTTQERKITITTSNIYQ